MNALDTITLDLPMIAALSAAQATRPGYAPSHYQVLADTIDQYDAANEHAVVMFQDAAGQQVAVSNNDVAYMLASIQHNMQAIGEWEAIQ